MKVMPAGHTRFDNSQLEETVFALAIAACPQVEGSKDIGENTEFPRNGRGLDRRRRAQRSRQTVLDDHELTETLTIGWAITLAIAVALAVYVSGA
jgi:hypothetical protein